MMKLFALQLAALMTIAVASNNTTTAPAVSITTTTPRNPCMNVPSPCQPTRSRCVEDPSGGSAAYVCECAPGYYAGPGLADVDGAACARVAVQSTEGNLVLEVPAGKDVNIHVGNARLTSIGDMVQDIATTSEALDAAKTDLSTRIISARDDLTQALKSADSALEARLEAAVLSLKTGLEASLQATDSQLRSIIDSVRSEASTGIEGVSKTLTSVNNNLGREVSANKASTITNRQALSTLEAKVAKASDSPPFEFFKDCGAFAAALGKKLSQNDRLKFKAQKKLTSKS